MKRIEKLTDAQRARFGEWRDKWISIGLRTGETDWEGAERGIRLAYEAAGIEFPANVVRVSSPMVGALAAAIAEALLKSGESYREVGRIANGAVTGAVRHAVRDAVDIEVRNAVHDAVGGAVSVAVGRAVENAVDIAVRGAVGIAVSLTVHNEVGDEVGVAVHAAVSNAVHNAVRSVSDAVYDAVDGAVGGAVSGVVDSAVHDAVDGAVSNAVRGAVRHEVADAVLGAVSNAVHNAVSNAVSHIKWHGWLGGQFWSGGWWGAPSAVSFFTDVCGLELDADIAKRAEANRLLSESAAYIWPNRAFVMICARPSAIRRDNQGRLHSDTRKSIEWPDGWGLYSLDGVTLEESLWKQITSGTMTFAEILAIPNADHQAVALKYNPLAIINEGADLVSTSNRGNELFRIEGREINRITEEPVLWFVKMKCPTGRTFVEPVEPGFAAANPDADICQGWLCGLKPDAYRNLAIEG